MSRTEAGVNLLIASGVLILLVFFAVPRSTWALLPTWGVDIVAEIVASAAAASIFAVPVLLYVVWAFVTQPVLRLSAHDISVAPRWVPWGRQYAFKLEDVRLRGNLQPNGDDALWANIHLEDDEHETIFAFRYWSITQREEASQELEWVITTLKDARARRIGDERGSQEELEEALASIRQTAAGQPE